VVEQFERGLPRRGRALSVRVSGGGREDGERVLPWGGVYRVGNRGSEGNAVFAVFVPGAILNY